MGFWVSVIALVAIPIVAILRLFGHDPFLGQATTLIAVLFLGGVQLIFLGVLGEYLGRIYDEVKNRPLYLTTEAPPKPRNEEQPTAAPNFADSRR
jgi:dolichol-phosphate mannosyltransferase